MFPFLYKRNGNKSLTQPLINRSNNRGLNASPQPPLSISRSTYNPPLPPLSISRSTRALPVESRRIKINNINLLGPMNSQKSLQNILRRNIVYQPIMTLLGHSRWVNSVAYSPDGRRIASGSDDTSLRVWDTELGTCLATFKRYSDWVHSVAYSPNGRNIA